MARHHKKKQNKQTKKMSNGTTMHEDAAGKDRGMSGESLKGKVPSMSDDEPNKELEVSIEQGVNESTDALNELSEKIEQHDAEAKDNESAASFLNVFVEKAKVAIEDLKTSAEEWKKDPRAQGAISMVEDALVKVNEAMDTLKTKAVAYDEKFQISTTAEKSVEVARENLTYVTSTAEKSVEVARENISYAKEGVSGLVNTCKERTHDALALVQERIEAVKSAIKGAAFDAATAAQTRVDGVRSSIEDKANEAVDMTSAKIAEIKTAASNKATETGDNLFVSAGGVANQLSALDKDYMVSETASSLLFQATEKAKDIDEQYGIMKKVQELDESYGISKKAMEMDEKYTGGKGAEALKKAPGLANESYEYVTEKVLEARTLAGGPNAPVVADESAPIASTN